MLCIWMDTNLHIEALRSAWSKAMKKSKHVGEDANTIFARIS